MKILIAEDDEVSRRVVESRLEKWGYEVISARDGAEAWETLKSNEGLRLAILDWMMPGMNGLEVCREVRKQTHRPYVYILLLTAKDQPGDIIEGLEAGADDYLVKPVRSEELKARLYAGNRILGVQEELISAREELRVQAIRDPLTDLFNRRYMEESLGRELHRAARAGSELGVAMLDLDHFKHFNDTFGHEAGDTLLRELGKLLRQQTRAGDIACRYGGEEFAVILPGATLETTRRRAEDLREAVKRLDVGYRSQRLGPITVSLGAAAFPEHASTAEELLRAADEALYQAKAQGRDRVVTHAPTSIAPDTGRQRAAVPYGPNR